ncbi:MAG: hypothetical protein WBM98_07410 [Maribacter sp.]|uniref:hypothetical protein n=1 Tax=Maribacter sp. TaxID=1897614 RepID=UPI003C76521A
MKFRSLFESKTENLGVRIRPADLKKIMDGGDRKFHLKWLTDNNFVISLNFSFGSNFIFDVNHPNTKSDIIFYGKLTEIEESKTEIKLKTRSKYFLAILLMVLPLLVLALQILMKIEFPVFLIALLFFPLIIIGFLNLIRGEENRLLRMFKEYLNNEIITHHNKV